MNEETPRQEAEAEYVERLFARGLVIAGGLFWVVAAFAGPYVYGGLSMVGSLKTAMWPLLTAVVILVIGWTYERLAAVLLFGASVAVLVWGTLYAWETGVWIIMTFVLIAPMTISGILFLLSARAEMRRTVPAPLPHRAEIPVRQAPSGAKVQTRPR